MRIARPGYIRALRKVAQGPPIWQIQIDERTVLLWLEFPGLELFPPEDVLVPRRMESEDSEDSIYLYPSPPEAMYSL